VNSSVDTLSVTNETSIAEENIPFDGLQKLRLEALNKFLEKGFPDSKHEEWKYLNLKPISETKYNHRVVVSQLKASDLEQFNDAGSDTVNLVFMNGRYCSEFSGHQSHKHPFSIYSLESREAELYLETLRNSEDEPFHALNTAFHQGGIMIHVPDDCRMPMAIHLLHVNDSQVEAVAAHPKCIVVAGKNSTFQVIATYHSLNNFPSLTNTVTEFLIGENAVVEFDIKQNENSNANHINRVYARVQRNAVFDIFTVTMGGALVRNNLEIILSEPNACAHLNGLTVADGYQVVDNHTVVDHASPNCESNQLYKNILDDHSQGVFNGKIFVRKDAQKTNAFQSSKNVLLSNTAVMNAKPQLEIFADDVKCSHGATTGQLDDDALFYFRSRGIGERDARALLNYAFASDVIEKINNDALKSNLLKLLSQKLNTTVEFEE